MKLNKCVICKKKFRLGKGAYYFSSALGGNVHIRCPMYNLSKQVPALPNKDIMSQQLMRTCNLCGNFIAQGSMVGFGAALYHAKCFKMETDNEKLREKLQEYAVMINNLIKIQKDTESKLKECQQLVGEIFL